jgi:hypothetical protein
MNIDQNLVGRLIDWEEGELPGEAVVALFQELVDNDLIAHVADNLCGRVDYFADFLLRTGAIHPKYLN